MAKHNDNLAPFERRQDRRWTRVGDYWPNADSRFGVIHWGEPVALSEYPVTKRPERNVRAQQRRLMLPLAVVALVLALSLWAGGLFGPNRTPALAPATTSKGLIFGLCNEGGLTNCVASGDSFYLGGKTVRIAGIEAPQLYGAGCPKEAELGRTSAVKLQTLLNSGELQLTKVPQDLDRYGLLLRNVAVDGKAVGPAMVNAGLARDIGNLTRSWC